MMPLQPKDYTSALIHADQEIQYARIAEDLHLQVASLIRKALVYFYLKRPGQRLWAYQEAAHYSQHVSPLLDSRVSRGLAEAYSDLAQHNEDFESEAWQALDLARKTFPDHPQEDPNFTYTHFKFPQGYEGLIYLNLNQPGKAWKALAEIDEATPALIIPDRVELTVRQARASVALGNLDQSEDYLQSAVASAKALGSQLRRSESYDIYQQMQKKWPNEQRVKELADLFR